MQAGYYYLKQTATPIQLPIEVVDMYLKVQKKLDSILIAQIKFIIIELVKLLKIKFQS
jgi:hypothetical protein